jgi:hypothetical protein
LKTWFDYVLRAAITFKYTESGAVGLLEGKRAIVIETRGGLYSEGPAQMMDSQEPHLRHLLSFMGITNVKFFRAELSLPSIGRPTPARSVRRGACAIHRRRVANRMKLGPWRLPGYLLRFQCRSINAFVGIVVDFPSQYAP